MQPRNDTSLTVLGIETSCDETAAAVVRRAAGGRGEILSSVVRSQLNLHAAYGGVVPEIAARAHVELLDAAIKQALAEADLGVAAMDAVAAAEVEPARCHERRPRPVRQDEGYDYPGDGQGGRRPGQCLPDARHHLNS